MLAGFGEIIGAGVKTITRVVNRNQGTYLQAMSKAGLRKVVLSVQESLHLQSAMHLTHSAVRLFRSESKRLGIPFSFAPEPQMRAAVQSKHVISEYYEGVALRGTTSNIACRCSRLRLRYT